MKKSKFDISSQIPLSFKIKEFFRSLLFWKGRSKGMIHTIDIGWREIRPIFFPKGFYDKYSYLGSIPYNEKSDYFKALYPLVLAMDYEAKPKWCPRWFLRFTHLFGNDNSIVRVRNRFWYKIHMKLTKGISFIDYKTKWSDYDLRISIHAPKHLQELADWIEDGFYHRGYKQELIDELKQLNPNANPGWNIEEIKKQIEIEEQRLQRESALDMLANQAQELDLGYNVTSDGKIKFKHEK